MPGTSAISPTITFATQISPLALSTLDTNFTQLTAYLNNANNYSNYLVDTGAANSYVVTFPTGVSATYTAGLTLYVKIANTNTGASTLTVYGLVAKNILNNDGSTLVANNLTAGKIVILVYDGTQFILIGSGTAAGLGGGAINTNTTSISYSTTIPSGQNGFSVGPITIASGQSVTITSGQRWVII
jgi:hypothetical protein